MLFGKLLVGILFVLLMLLGLVIVYVKDDMKVVE